MTCACSRSSSTIRMLDLIGSLSGMRAYCRGDGGVAESERQEDAKAGAFGGFAVDLKFSAVLLDDALGHGQADAGAASFGGVVRLEDLGQDLRIDAGAGVGD